MESTREMKKKGKKARERERERVRESELWIVLCAVPSRVVQSCLVEAVNLTIPLSKTIQPWSFSATCKGVINHLWDKTTQAVSGTQR